MARVYREGDIGDEITTRKVAILGYGSQGHAHALNLKESGCDVTVGLYEGSKSWPKAEEDGLAVKTIADAVRDADVVMMLLPDEKQPAVFQAEVGPNLSEGDLMLFAHGFNIHFNQIVVPPEVDLGSRRPQRTRTRAQASLRRGQRHAFALRGRERRFGAGAGCDPLLRPRHRERPRRHHRDHLRRRDRDRPLRRAGGVVRRA